MAVRGDLSRRTESRLMAAPGPSAEPPAADDTADPSGAEMALHHDTDVVRAIVGARQVKFLFGPARSQGQDTLA
jgi:hypothetical protein